GAAARSRTPPLPPPQHDRRDPLCDDGPGRRPPAQCERLLDEVFGILEAALHQREQAAMRPDLPALRGLAQLVGERVERVELDLERCAIAEHPEAVEAVIVALEP